MNYSVNNLSRKTMWVIIAAIIIVGVAFFLALYRNSMSAQIQYVAPAISASTVSATSAVLADGDWQKVLVGTNSTVSIQRKSLGTGTSSGQLPPLTETEKLGQSVISDYLQLKQSGGTQSTSTINAVISHALNNQSIVTTAKVYSFSDIKIGRDDSITANLIYGQKLAALFKNNNAVGNEAVYARDGAEQKDPTILAKIDPIITTYKNILNGLLAITAPPTLAKIHLDLVNAMSERITVAELLRNVNTDPAAGLQGVGQYMNGLQDLDNAFGALKQYFDTLKTNFSTTTAASFMPGSSK